MAPHSSTLAWKIPWTEEPGMLQSMGLRGVRHDWTTLLSLFTFTHWRRKWQPTPVFLPGESQGWGSLVGCRLWGRTQLKSQTRKWLSSSSSSSRKYSGWQNKLWGTSLVIQWLRLHTPNAEGPSSIPGQGTRCPMLQLRVCMQQWWSKILCAATKTWHNQINKLINN